MFSRTVNLGMTTTICGEEYPTSVKIVASKRQWKKIIKDLRRRELEDEAERLELLCASHFSGKLVKRGWRPAGSSPRDYQWYVRWSSTTNWHDRVSVVVYKKAPADYLDLTRCEITSHMSFLPYRRRDDFTTIAAARRYAENLVKGRVDMKHMPFHPHASYHFDDAKTEKKNA